MADPGRKRKMTKRLLKPIAGQQKLSFQPAKDDSSEGESSEPAPPKRRTSPRLAPSTSRLLSVLRHRDHASIESPSTSRKATAANVPHVSPSKELAQPSTSYASITPSKDPPSTSRSTPVTRSSLKRLRPTDPPDPSEHDSDGGEDGDEDGDEDWDDEGDPIEGKNMQCCRS